MNRYSRRLAIFLLLLFVFALDLSTIHAQAKSDPGNDGPDSPALTHYRVGAYYQLKGDHQRAIAEFTQTIEALPMMGYAYAARGDSYAALGEYDAAIADYTQAVAIYPDYVSALYTRGRAYDASGRTGLAIADYLNAIGQMPDYPNPYWGLGDLFYEAGDYHQALQNYQAYLARETTPDAQVVARVAQLEVAA